MPLTIDFPSKSVAEQYCTLTNAQGAEIIPSKTGATVRFKNAPLIESLKNGQFKLAQQQHDQLTVVQIPGLAQPLIAKVTNETFTCKIEPPEDAVDWLNDSDEDEFPKLQNLKFEDCTFIGLWLGSNRSAFSGCKFHKCGFAGEELFSARVGIAGAAYTKCQLQKCQIVGLQSDPGDYYDLIIQMPKTMVSPSIAFNECLFHGIFVTPPNFGQCDFVGCKTRSLQALDKQPLGFPVDLKKVSLQEETDLVDSLFELVNRIEETFPYEALESAWEKLATKEEQKAESLYWQKKSAKQPPLDQKWPPEQDSPARKWFTENSDRVEKHVEELAARDFGDVWEPSWWGDEGCGDYGAFINFIAEYADGVQLSADSWLEEL